MRSIVLFAPLAGCMAAVVDIDPGTSVGNPNMAKVRLDLADLDGFDHEHAIYPVGEVLLESCGGRDEVWELSQFVQIDGGELRRPPIGAWCAQTWEPTGNVIISGMYGETPYRFEIEEPQVELDGTWEVTEDGEFVLELGYTGWIAFFRDPLSRGEAIDMGPDHPYHDRLRWIFEHGAGMYRDRNRDGRVDDDERDRWLIARGSDRE